MLSDGERILLGLVTTGFFQIRDDGTIWRTQRRTRSGALTAIAPARADYPGAKGYRSIKAQVNGIVYRTQAHRLIWIAAKGPIPEGIEVNHENGRRGHNSRSNLNLLTHGENQKHSYDNLGRTRCVGERNGSAKLSIEQVSTIRSRRGSKPSRAVGIEFGISHRQVLNIWNGKAWAA